MATIPKPHARQPPRLIWKVGEERAALMRLLYGQPQAGSNTAQRETASAARRAKPLKRTTRLTIETSLPHAASFPDLASHRVSVVALLMAAIGIYGLIQYSIAMRTREIGIRMAVGAQAGQIFRMIILEGLKLSLTGLAVGLVGALWLGWAVSSLLFGVTATDPLTFITVSLLLTAVATAACYFPARRAMKVEPIVALRQE